ncbi:MAG: PD40 domain-containing protein [Acholeplasmataceae bacterium]|nr:PD40 domain-containing protein [Acholeplasmataceae bacterium]
MRKRKLPLSMLLVTIVCLFIMLSACEKKETHPDIDRLTKLPTDIIKRTPENDHHPPILYSDDFDEPVPLNSNINTSGLEDSPYISEDGNTLYFFFTPDARVEHSLQLLDGVTGIWKSTKIDGTWGPATRVWLQQPGKLALDGCPTIHGDILWFCSAREGYTGVMMFTAHRSPNLWSDWQYVGDKLMIDFQIGEVHLHEENLYFHSAREGGLGGFDIWSTTQVGGEWQNPVNIEAVNSEANEGMPFITYDGNELWFNRTYMGTPGLFRSMKVEGVWQTPELIMSMFAGEPTLDGAGNVYFIHHYYENDVAIEADIYIAYRKT